MFNLNSFVPSLSFVSSVEDLDHPHPFDSYPNDQEALVPHLSFNEQETSSSHHGKYLKNKASISEFNQRIQSTLCFAKNPYLQCMERVDYSVTTSARLSSSIPFANWPETMQEQAVQSLLKLGVPLKKVTLDQIYHLLHKKDICSNSQIIYPALFKGKACYQKETTSRSDSPSTQSISFELEVHSEKKAYLIFRKHQDTFIAQGGFKTLTKAYPLGNPKKFFTYSHSRLDLHSSLAEEVMDKEQFFLVNYAGKSHIAKIYEIFYYKMIYKNEWRKQQIIIMKYYPYDLFHILTSHDPQLVLSDQMKIRYCLCIAETVIYLHRKGVLHRDLKLENILISLKKEIGVIDFGLACRLDDIKARQKVLGTPSFLAPEGFSWELTKGQSLDIWALGCIFWLILSNAHVVYPWYEEANKYEDNPNIQTIIEWMLFYDQCPPPCQSQMTFLLWNMLRFNVANRWDIEKILEFLRTMAKDLPTENTFNFANQFQAEYEPQKKQIEKLREEKLKKLQIHKR